MKYTVHLYTAVRIRVEDIEANSQEEAFAKAAEECDVKHNLTYGHFEDDEAPFLGAMVDEAGDEDAYIKTRYHEGPGASNYLRDAEAIPKLLTALEAIRDQLVLHPDAHIGSKIVHFALMKVLGAIAEAKGEK